MPDKIFYSIPFRAEKLTQKGRLEKCDLAASVRQNLRLLLMTPPMQVRHDSAYGCIIHWRQFLADNWAMEEEKRMEDNFKIALEKNIKQLLEKFEPRIHLQELLVDVKYSEETHTRWLLLRRQRKQNNTIQIIVNIKGKVKEEYIFDGQSLDLEDTIPLL